MRGKAIREFIYRLFASVVVIAIEVSIYFALIAVIIKPAQDVYEADCAKQASSCEAFPLATQSRLIFIAILVGSIILLALYTLWPLIRKQSVTSPTYAGETHADEIIEDEEDV